MISDKRPFDMAWAPVRLRAAVYVEHEDRVLLVYDPVYRGGCWLFPGGAAEFNETAIQAAEREVLEETGITVRVQGLWHIHEAWEPEADNPNERPEIRRTMELIFTGSYVEGSIAVGKDPSRKADGIPRVKECRWIPVRELLPTIEGAPFYPVEVAAARTALGMRIVPVKDIFLPPLTL